jgi:hypothetical protein
MWPIGGVALRCGEVGVADVRGEPASVAYTPVKVRVGPCGDSLAAPAARPDVQAALDLDLDLDFSGSTTQRSRPREGPASL